VYNRGAKIESFKNEDINLPNFKNKSPFHNENKISLSDALKLKNETFNLINMNNNNSEKSKTTSLPKPAFKINNQNSLLSTLNEKEKSIVAENAFLLTHKNNTQQLHKKFKFDKIEKNDREKDKPHHLYNNLPIMPIKKQSDNSAVSTSTIASVPNAKKKITMVSTGMCTDSSDTSECLTTTLFTKPHAHKYEITKITEEDSVYEKQNYRPLIKLNKNPIIETLGHSYGMGMCGDFRDNNSEIGSINIKEIHIDKNNVHDRQDIKDNKGKLRLIQSGRDYNKYNNTNPQHKRGNSDLTSLSKNKEFNL